MVCLFQPRLTVKRRSSRLLMGWKASLQAYALVLSGTSFDPDSKIYSIASSTITRELIESTVAPHM